MYLCDSQNFRAPPKEYQKLIPAIIFIYAESKIRERLYYSRQELGVAFQEEWQRTPRAEVRHIIFSVPHAAACGGHTRY